MRLAHRIWAAQVAATLTAQSFLKNNSKKASLKIPEPLTGMLGGDVKAYIIIQAIVITYIIVLEH